VSIKSGPPQPTCRPGQICGLPCLLNCGGPGCIFLCGCIGPFCPVSNCVGAGCTDTGGAAGSPDDSTCRERQTASYCNVECSVLKYPASATTWCKNPDCTRTVTACTATDSTTTTTTTLTCPTPILSDYGSPDDDVAILGDGGYGGVVIDEGTFDYPPITVTVTRTVSPVAVSTSTQTVVVAPTASADCAFWYVYSPS
jgi:chitinase